MTIIVNSKERAGAYMETTLNLRLETIADFQAFREFTGRLNVTRLGTIMPANTPQAVIDLLETWASATKGALDVIATDRGYPAS